MEAYTYTKESLEEFIDQCKVAFLDNLVSEDLINKDVADEWCARHTLVLKKKSFFRTITSAWLKAKQNDNEICLIVVKKLPTREN